MADFYGPSVNHDGISTDAAEDSFANRFPEWALGRDIWQAWLEQGRWAEEPEEALDQLIDRLREAFPNPQPRCPRVFVSHRHHDAAEALRIAWLANQSGFEFWLDLLDPQLHWLTATESAAQPAYFTLIASIIEIALLNCTHVIAVLSDHTRGTLWVPYEYGRIKERKIHSKRAAVWLHRNILQNDIPEYTVLGVTTRLEREISVWLNTGLLTWCKSTKDCCDGAGNDWSDGETIPLPLKA
jgi:hypothetical protein